MCELRLPRRALSGLERKTREVWIPIWFPHWRTLSHKLSHAQPWTQWCENEALPSLVPYQAWPETQHKKLKVSPFFSHTMTVSWSAQKQAHLHLLCKRWTPDSFYLLHRRYFTCRPVKTVPKSLAFNALSQQGKKEGEMERGGKDAQQQLHAIFQPC